MANTIVWFDLPVANLEKARNFYSKLLDKELCVHEEHGFKMVVFPHEDCSSDVAGCLYEAEDFTPNTSNLLIYFDTDKRINKAVEAAKAHGGTVVTPVEPIGPWGYRAVIADCCGNKVALYAKELD